MQYATESTKNTEMMHTKTAMMNVFMNMRGKLSTLVSVNRLM